METASTLSSSQQVLRISIPARGNISTIVAARPPRRVNEQQQRVEHSGDPHLLAGQSSFLARGLRGWPNHDLLMGREGLVGGEALVIVGQYKRRVTSGYDTFLSSIIGEKEAEKST